LRTHKYIATNVGGLIMLQTLASFYNAYVTVHRVKFLIMQPTSCANFSNLFLEWNSACFGQFLCPSSVVFHCTHSNGVCHIGYGDSLRTASGWSILLLLASCQHSCMT